MSMDLEKRSAGGDKRNVHVSDDIRIDELTFVLPNQFPTANAMPFVAMGRALRLQRRGGHIRTRGLLNGPDWGLTLANGVELNP